MTVLGEDVDYAYAGEVAFAFHAANGSGNWYWYGSNYFPTLGHFSHIVISFDSNYIDYYCLHFN